MSETMGQPWQYQLRVYLSDEMAEVARADRGDPALAPLRAVLDRHGATMRSQFDAFAEYLAEAEREGVERYPLYSWTKATLDEPANRLKHSRVYALHVGGREVYAKEAADGLEADLQPLVGGALVTRLSRHDTNPANNMPVPAEYRS